MSWLSLRKEAQQLHTMQAEVKALRSGTDLQQSSFLMKQMPGKLSAQPTGM